MMRRFLSSSKKAFPSAPVRASERYQQVVDQFQQARRSPGGAAAVEQLVMDTPDERLSPALCDTALRFLAKQQSTSSSSAAAAASKLVRVASNSPALTNKAKTTIIYSLGKSQILSEVPADLVARLGEGVDEYNAQDVAFCAYGLGKLVPGAAASSTYSDLVAKLERRVEQLEDVGSPQVLANMALGLASLRPQQPASPAVQQKLTQWVSAADVKLMHNPDLVSLACGLASLLDKESGEGGGVLKQVVLGEVEARPKFKPEDVSRLQVAYKNAGLEGKSAEALDRFVLINKQAALASQQQAHEARYAASS